MQWRKRLDLSVTNKQLLVTVTLAGLSRRCHTVFKRKMAAWAATPTMAMDAGRLMLVSKTAKQMLVITPLARSQRSAALPKAMADACVLRSMPAVSSTRIRSLRRTFPALVKSLLLARGQLMMPTSTVLGVDPRRPEIQLLPQLRQIFQKDQIVAYQYRILTWMGQRYTMLLRKRESPIMGIAASAFCHDTQRIRRRQAALRRLSRRQGYPNPARLRQQPDRVAARCSPRRGSAAKISWSTVWTTRCIRRVTSKLGKQLLKTRRHRIMQS
ncbi:hypothetical protein PBRA_009351 [Plasmodiophora brassicae]|uniref:Uncharacterized protein n=1 Tax=Plasmodiophora brassicae TaxID=37360 RepID=A0A0G4J6D2_PLABS|nr:hypothetical protein PBRA_009351 [Plasmodiophora brassicae]